MPLRGRLNTLERKVFDVAEVCQLCGSPHVEALLTRLWDPDATTPESVCACEPCGCREALALLDALDDDGPRGGGETAPAPKPRPRAPKRKAPASR